jgi:excinuclease UvrABC nuclease subunit
MAEALMQAEYMAPKEKSLKVVNEELLAKAQQNASKLKFPTYSEIIDAFSAREQVTPEEARNLLKNKYDFDSYESFTKSLITEISQKVGGAALSQQRTYLELQRANNALRECLEHGNLQVYGVCNTCHLPKTFPVCVPVAQVIK